MHHYRVSAEPDRRLSRVIRPRRRLDSACRHAGQPGRVSRLAPRQPDRRRRWQCTAIWCRASAGFQSLQHIWNFCQRAENMFHAVPAQRACQREPAGLCLRRAAALVWTPGMRSHFSPIGRLLRTTRLPDHDADHSCRTQRARAGYCPVGHSLPGRFDDPRRRRVNRM